MSTATANGETTAQTEIRRLMEHWAKAIRAKDIDQTVTQYASDVLMFDVVNPLQTVGVDAVRKRLEEWLSSFEGPIDFENRDLSISAGDEVAFCHSLNHIEATTKDGQKFDMYWRATLCFRKIEGQWMVTHTHASVPFDVETGRASLDLEP